MSYAQRVLSGYNSMAVSGGAKSGKRAGPTTPAPKTSFPMQRYSPRNFPKFQPANLPRPLQVPTNLSGPPRVPRRVWRRLMRSALRRWPLVGFGIEWYANYHSEFPGFDAISAGWRKPVVTPEYAPGDYVPNPFDHGSFDNPPESLLDTDDTIFPSWIRFWGDHGTNPYAPGAPRPYILPRPLRFDEETPLSQPGPHPLAEPIPRYQPTVKDQKDYVTRPKRAPQRLPAQVFADLFTPGLGAPAVQKRPHTKKRPHRNEPHKKELKMGDRITRILTAFYDAEEVVQIFGDALRIIMQPDWFRTTHGRGWRKNNKAEQLRNLFAQEIAENLIIIFIRRRGGKSPWHAAKLLTP